MIGSKKEECFKVSTLQGFKETGVARFNLETLKPCNFETCPYEP